MPIKSVHADVEIPDVTIHEFVLAKADQLGSKTALLDATSGQSLTFEQFARATRALAGAFAARGLGKGDVIALFSPNTILYPVVFHAASLAGLSLTTLNALYTAKDVAAQLTDSKAKLLITVSPCLDRAVEGAGRAGTEEVMVCDQAEGHASIQDLILEGHQAPSHSFDPANNVVVLPYSSGTTGLPKGVMLTHRNLVTNLLQFNHMAKHDADDTLLAVLPFFHIYGMQVLMNGGLAFGSTVVTMPKFDLRPYLAALAEHKVTRAYVAPPIVMALAKHPLVADFDLSHLRGIFSGAAPLDGELAGLCSKRLNVPVAQGYGMTELSPVTHAVRLGDTPVPGSIGQMVPNTECRLVDLETGGDTAVGAEGELWIRGPQVMKGYLNRPDDTTDTIDSEGWLHTGDVARVDEHGNFFIVDRMKELIKYKGYQVAPAELEAELLTSPQIADAAVIRATLDGEEVPKAFVVPAASASDLTAEQVIAYIEGRVSPHKKIRIVEFIDAIPRSAAGKILRKDLPVPVP